MCVIKYYELIRALHNVITFVSYVVTMVIYTIIKNIHGTHFGHLVLNTIVCLLCGTKLLQNVLEIRLHIFTTKFEIIFCNILQRILLVCAINLIMTFNFCS